jgi:hypothetical protein
MEINIVTLAYNRPDFIELQLKSLKKYVKDFTYTVFDNAPDDSVKDECERLGVKCVPIKILGSDPSLVVGKSLNAMWETLQHAKGQLMYIDSDMFLTGELPDMKDYDFAFVPQTRPNDVLYPWTGLMLFNMDTLPAPGDLTWEVGYALGADVGGLNHFYLQKHNPKVLELEMWTLTPDGCSFNGAESSCKPEHGEMERIDLPRPFDIFKVNGESFVLHYKSASNYPDFYTPEYNERKTKALCKLLT